MFESDEWMFEVACNDVHEKTIQTHPQCQNKEDVTSTKRRKIDYCKALFSSENNVCETKLVVTKDAEDNNSSLGSKDNVARQHLLGIFQKNTDQKETKQKQCPQLSKTNASNISSCKEYIEKNDINIADRANLGKEAKLIRIFPGPAGLVSPIKDDNTSIALYLDSIKELERKPAIGFNKNNFSKSYHEEKNLFNEKSWKFLLDDLPKNFFIDYSISTIKSRANASHCNSMKVKFIAGILDYIDHSHDDPFVVLRDSTDSIEGTIHRDIPLKYPGILEPNVVIFLYDVGLLKTTSQHIVMNKYHILVSQVNLLAVYSNKGRIIHTSHMENILSSISNVELTRSDSVTPVSNPCNNIIASASTSNNQQVNTKPVTVNNSTSSQRLNEKHKNSKETSKKDNQNCKATNKIFESFEFMDDDINDAFFTTENEPLVSDETTKYSNCSLFESTSARISDIQLCEQQTQNTNLEDVNKGSSVSSRSKLKSASSVARCNIENSKNLASYFTDKMLNDNEFDSDDEILSQLDVDNIVSNSKRDC